MKRNEEARQKVDDAVHFVFGDRVKDMFYIAIIASNPNNDLHNHAGELVDAVTGLVSCIHCVAEIGADSS